MFYLQNLSKEKAKELLIELLNHKTHVDPKFETIRKRVGAFSDEKLRLFLVEVVGGIKILGNKNGLEYWYLKSREVERPNSTPEGYR